MQEITPEMKQEVAVAAPDRLRAKSDYEMMMRRASKEIVRVLRNLERTRPDLEPDDRYKMAVHVVTSPKGGF